MVFEPSDNFFMCDRLDDGKRLHRIISKVPGRRIIHPVELVNQPKEDTRYLEIHVYPDCNRTGYTASGAGGICHKVPGMRNQVRNDTEINKFVARRVRRARKG